jgi:WD40 repeat protein
MRKLQVLLFALILPAFAACGQRAADPPAGKGDQPTPAAPASTTSTKEAPPADLPAPKVLKGHVGNVNHLAFSADGKTLVSCGYSHADKTAIVWDMPSGKVRSKVEEKEHGIWSVAISPDGKTLATGNLAIKLWSTATGKEITATKEGAPSGHGLAFSPDGTLLAYGTSTDDVVLWDVSAGKPQKRLEGHKHSVVSTAFSSDGKTLASGDHQGVVKLWEMPGGKERCTIKADSERINLVALSPDGKLIAMGSESRAVKLWDASTGKEVATRPPDLLGREDPQGPRHRPGGHARRRDGPEP